jgi:hypothetical protein
MKKRFNDIKNRPRLRRDPFVADVLFMLNLFYEVFAPLAHFPPILYTLAGPRAASYFAFLGRAPSCPWPGPELSMAN